MVDTDIYKRLEIKKLINAGGTYTMIGGSRMSPETLEAMRCAAQSFVDVRDLHEKINKRLAKITNNEAALVVSCAAAGLHLLAAACVSLKFGKHFSYLAPEQVSQSEIIVFRAHRNPYDWSLQQLGVKLVEVGYPNLILPTRVCDLEQVINHNTVAIFSTEMVGGWAAEGALDLDATLEVAQRHGIPVVVDAAAQLPPVENLWSFNKRGVSATVFSGGKDLRGPQASGLITGSRGLLQTATDIAFPYYGIGRMLKISREEMVGLLVAVEQYVNLDHEARAAWCQAQIDILKRAFSNYQCVEVVDSYPNEAGQPIGRAIVRFTQTGLTSEKLVSRLRAGDPGIFVVAAGDEAIYINPMTLEPGEINLVVERLQAIFDEFNVG